MSAGLICTDPAVRFPLAGFGEDPMDEGYRNVGHKASDIESVPSHVGRPGP